MIYTIVVCKKDKNNNNKPAISKIIKNKDIIVIINK